MQISACEEQTRHRCIGGDVTAVRCWGPASDVQKIYEAQYNKVQGMCNVQYCKMYSLSRR